MLKSLKRIFDVPAVDPYALERQQLQLAAAVLVHEARRADYDEGAKEADAGVAALAELFGLQCAQARSLLARGREKAQQLSSFYAPLGAIKRAYGPAERVRLVEHLWRVSFADGLLNPYEDHYVRKIAHLLHVPNTESILARNRARQARGGA